MAAPVIGRGHTTSMVIVPETTFGTLATGSEIAVPFVSESISQAFTYRPNVIKIGKGIGARRVPTVAHQRNGGTIQMWADYKNMSRFLKQACGSEELGSGGTTNVYTLTDEITISSSIVIDKNVERFQFTGGYIEEFRLLGNVDDDEGMIKLETDWIFAKATTSATAISEETLAESPKMLMDDLTFRIHSVNAALSSSHNLAIKSFTLSCKHNMRENDFQSGSAYIVAPTRANPRDVSLKFTAYNYTDNAVITVVKTALRAHTQLQASLSWSKTVGANTYSFSIRIPQLFALEMDNEPISDDGLLTFQANLGAYENTDNKTHMADTTKEFDITTNT